MYAGYYKRDYVNFHNEIEHLQKYYDFNNFKYFDEREIQEQFKQYKIRENGEWFEFTPNLAEKVLKKINEISERSGYPIANLLHAGDGNLHPSILFDERKPGDVENILAIGAEILRICVDSGGVLSGEHGIGLEKQDQMPLMFSEEDMATMSLLKLAFETEDLLNPGKVFPTGAGCGDISQARAIARVGPGAYI